VDSYFAPHDVQNLTDRDPIILRLSLPMMSENEGPNRSTAICGTKNAGPENAGPKFHDYNKGSEDAGPETAGLESAGLETAGLETAGPMIHVTQKRLVTPFKKCCRFL